jgi:hypothetical protein
MTNEDRLLSLLNQARLQRGDAILQSPGELGAMLAGWAPDLAGEARALALALSQNAGGAILAAPNADAETARIAAQTATQAGVAPAAATVALNVVRRLYTPSAATPIGAVPFYEQGALKKTWVRVVLALMAFGLVFNLLTGKFQHPADPNPPAQTGTPQQ